MTWKKIKGHENYSVSDTGLIRNNNTGRIRKGIPNYHGYLRVLLDQKQIRIHRAVALAFLPNPLNKPQVNHKNGDKTDNRVENLEWVTDEENRQHAINVLGVPEQAKTLLCVETGVIYKSIGEAGRSLGMTPEQFRKKVKEQKTVRGFHWKFL